MHLFHESHSALLSWDIWWYLQTFYDIYLDCLFSVFFWIVFFCIRIFCIRIFFSLLISVDICWYLVFIFGLLPNHLLHLCEDLLLSLGPLLMVEVGQGSLFISTINLVLFSQTNSFHSTMSEISQWKQVCSFMKLLQNGNLEKLNWK